MDILGENGSYLTEDFWRIYLDGWEESGFEVYKKYETTMQPIPQETEEQKAKNAMLLKVISRMEQGKSI